MYSGYFNLILFIGIVIFYTIYFYSYCFRCKNKIEKFKNYFYNSPYILTENNFESYKIYDFSPIKLNKNICLICRDNILKNQNIIKLQCNHIYHINCIKLWFNQELKCPYCRNYVI